ncbi:arylesterase [Sphingomonas sp. AP4-R1]|uniref:arylesterase n=1 Tax=Sphingomonas sp. AP4-R1 TaxID=2735134 RepID=UPI0014933897|nr:arylesterase [Sphingomonas sp. AP4-R1]QJU60193.1 arylesterase [Sphingomonas sp. AP4-R1]
MPDVAVATAPLILALGDSLTAGYGLAAHESFASQLEIRLGSALPGTRVINAGVSGDTSADALRRLPRLLSSLTGRPDLALVELGANDCTRGVPPAQVRANLSAIVEEFSRCAIPVLLATVEPPPFMARTLSGYLSVYTEVATRYGLPTCAFFPAGVLGHPQMVLPDRLHPNARAVALCADSVAPHVLKALGGPSARAA